MDYLTVEEVAILRECSIQYARRLLKNGKLESIQETNCKGRPKYLIPVTALPENLQAKYYRQKRTEAGILPEKKDGQVPESTSKTSLKYGLKDTYKPFEEFSEKEREQIRFWTELLMLMCTTMPQQIKRDGVKVVVCGEELWYWNPTETVMHMKEKVYVRYDPADLRTARIYDAGTDKFLFQKVHAYTKSFMYPVG